MSIPNYKDIIELVKKGMTIEAQEKIMEFREAAMELQEENLKLRERVQALESQIKQSKNLIFEQEMYWSTDEQGQKEGPFCSVCYDKDKKIVRVHDGVNFGFKWRCPVCFKGWIKIGGSGPAYGSIKRGRTIPWL